MRLKRGHRYAILTGDIVESSRLPAGDRRRLTRVIASCGAAVARAFADARPLGFESYRGDSWQLVLQHAPRALRVAVYFRAVLRVQMDSAAADSRIAIGIGGIDFIPGDKITQGDGVAYRLSGRGLDELDRRARMRADIDGETRDTPLDAVVTLVDALVSSWTPSQARAVLGALTEQTQKRIAARWKPEPISQQAVAQHLDRARWHAVEHGLRAFEAHALRPTPAKA